MKNLTNLFKLIELTRHIQQYGYVPAGIKRSDLSNIAEHQYLVTFIAWQLALYLKEKGANINIQRVMEISMVHDVGEILGGDISYYYGRSNPSARKAAKAFEQENINYLSQFFDNSKYFLDLHKMERGEIKSDEAIVERFGDLIEALHFKFTLNALLKNEVNETIKDLKKLLNRAEDPIVKRELLKFLNLWGKSLARGSTVDIIRGQKK
jgi:5'-deoxynucleotidase YfbR-like HD superfamily hydrolase